MVQVLDMSEQKIRNMRVISDDPTLIHTWQFGPVAIGEIHPMYGRDYRVIDNWQMTVVTYEPVDQKTLMSDIVIDDPAWKELRERLEGYDFSAEDIYRITDAILESQKKEDSDESSNL